SCVTAGIATGTEWNSPTIGRTGGVLTSTSPRFFLMQETTTSATLVGVARPTIFGALTPSFSHRAYIPVSVTNPGQTTENPTGCLWYSHRNELVKPTRPCLLVAYATANGTPTFPAPEATLTMCPRLRSNMPGSTERVSCTAAIRFTSIVLAKSSGDAVSK